MNINITHVNYNNENFLCLSKLQNFIVYTFNNSTIYYDILQLLRMFV